MLPYTTRSPAEPSRFHQLLPPAFCAVPFWRRRSLLPREYSYARAIAAEPERATTPTAPARACRTGWGTTALLPIARRFSALCAQSALSKGARRARAATMWIMPAAGPSASLVVSTIPAAQGRHSSISHKHTARLRSHVQDAILTAASVACGLVQVLTAGCT